MNLSEQISKSIENNKCFICNRKYIKLNRKNNKKSCNNSNCNVVWFIDNWIHIRYNDIYFILDMSNLKYFSATYNKQMIISDLNELVKRNYYNINLDNYLADQTWENLIKIAHDINKVLVFK